MNRRLARSALLLAIAAVLIWVAACNRPVSTGPLPAPGAQSVVGTPTPEGLTTDVALTVEAGATQTAAAVGQPTVPPVEVATNTPSAPAPVQPTAQPPAPTAQPPAATSAPGLPTTYTVKPGDRLFSIGRQFGVSPYAIAQANRIYYPYIIYPGQVLTIPAAGPVTPVPGPGPTTYIVRPGDTLFSIARRYGRSVAAVINANNLVNPNLIFPGQVIRIP